jgi:antitoxin component YwqK of YwqJK toxin-antitoxin module
MVEGAERMQEGDYVNGQKEGRWVSYFANGQIMSEGDYHLGRKEGKWMQYWPNGNKKSEATFVGGNNIGLYVCYYENGNKKWEGYYNPIRGNSADGTKEGVWLSYDEETGEVCRIITYRRGSRARPDQYPPFEQIPQLGPPPTERSAVIPEAVSGVR